MQCSNPASIVSTATLYTSSAPGTPGAPYQISISVPGNNEGELTIGWGAVSGAAYYNLIHSGGIQESMYGTSVTITGLATPGTVTFAIQACNSSGQCGAIGQTATFSIPAYSAPVPGAPGGMTLVNQGLNSDGTAWIELSWSAVANATYYNIIHEGGAIEQGNIAGTSTIISELSAGGTLTIALQACNSSGCGPVGAYQVALDVGIGF